MVMVMGGEIRRNERCLRRCGIAVVCIAGGIGPDIRGVWGVSEETNHVQRHVIPSSACPPTTDDHAASASLSGVVRVRSEGFDYLSFGWLLAGVLGE